jgi:hypothetical protein
MSVLETPRLIFRGNVTWDPIVTNNQPQQYDEVDGKAVLDGGAGSVVAFRNDAIEAAVNGGNWNPHGTHRSKFYDTFIVGVDNGDGPSVDDPIVKNPVSFTGMLVDLEPYGAFSSQLFFDAMSFGIQGGCRVFAPRATRTTARYINFFRNPANNQIAGVASVVWQTSFPKTGGLRVDPHDSPTLQRFAEALKKDDDVVGLTVRWNAYRTIYFDSLDSSKSAALAQELHAKLVGGGFQPNPARSKVVGVLGLWRIGEPAGEPGDRVLLTQQPRNMASAHVRLSADRLVLDLANSIPETTVDMVKKDLGELTAVAVEGQSAVATLGTFGYATYNREAYDATAGIVTLKVDPAAAQKAQRADIQIRQKNGQVLLAESALRAIPVHANNYLDEGETNRLDVLVLDRGRPAGAGIKVTMSNPDASTAASVTATTDMRAVATFPLRGTTGQVEGFILTPGQATPATRIDPQTTTYVYVRTLPADTDIAALAPSWENVHGRVLRNWQAMAPCMDNWLDLGNPDQIKSFAAILRRLTDKANFDSLLFMPVTRDMTAGQRSLLYKFLDGALPSDSLELASSEMSLKDMSRAMRGGQAQGARARS